MLFNFSKNKQAAIDVNAVLAEIKTNGIELSINELVQYQSKSSLINLKPQRNLHGKMSGNFLSRSKGRGMEFDEVRHYQTGDDIRAIDWRVTARTGKTHTKIFREEVERPVLIATDLSESMLFGSELLFKSIQASHVAALVAWHAKSRGDRVGGIVFNEDSHNELKPRSRKEGVLHYLHALIKIHDNSLNTNLLQASYSDENSETNSSSQVSAKQSVSFADNCARIRHIAKPGSLVYLITDGHHVNNDAIRHLSHISRHCELIVCLISDKLEHQLPTSHHKINVAITDGVERQYFTLGDKNTQQKYQQVAQEKQKTMENLFAKAGARLITFDAGSTIESQLKSGMVQ